MRIVFDHGTPSGIAQSLAGHEVTEAIERGWERISNGELITKAEAAGFELLLTTDIQIRYQQNLTGRQSSRTIRTVVFRTLLKTAVELVVERSSFKKT